MKTILLFFALFVSSVVADGQNYTEIKATQKNGKTHKIKNVKVDLKSRTLTYKDFQGNYTSKSLDAFTKLKYKNGSYWLEGLVGGFAGSVIANIMMRKQGEQWWYGLGQSVVVGTLPATFICSLIPKYTAINLGKRARVEVSPLALRLRF